MTFAYILDKIRQAQWSEDPFPHIQIKELFVPAHFAAITAAPEISLPPSANDGELFDRLFAAGYKIIDFPGCITDRNVYTGWHAGKAAGHGFNNTSCEGFGVTLRLTEARSPIVAELQAFLHSRPFLTAICTKLGLATDRSYQVDIGIQKYLDGYEISPHPDVRRKAMTFMVNVNSDPASEDREHHTHYLRFREEYRYVQAYWAGNPGRDRCWVPWRWCETVRIQRENNSLVFFSPDDRTLHGVKAVYDHLSHQRTQLYGNLWYRGFPAMATPSWENFVVGDQPQIMRQPPTPVDAAVIGNRLSVRR